MRRKCSLSRFDPEQNLLWLIFGFPLCFGADEDLTGAGLPHRGQGCRAQAHGQVRSQGVTGMLGRSSWRGPRIGEDAILAECNISFGSISNDEESFRTCRFLMARHGSHNVNRALPVAIRPKLP